MGNFWLCITPCIPKHAKNMDARTLQFYYDGKETPETAPIQVQAGPITSLFQPESGFLRYLRVGDHELVRGIYGAVRDANWDTMDPIVSNIQTDVNDGSFEIGFDALCHQGALKFGWRGSIKGEESGRITYDFNGTALTAFQSNRIGLCLLHPVTECAGKACTIEHVDGSTEQGFFPKHIAPHQPFKSIRKVCYEPAPGVKVQIHFAGEEFEMEDQRNWTDASFKTYGTPLDLPFPVSIKAGTQVHQTVIVSLPGKPRKLLPIQLGRTPQLSIATTSVIPKPGLGLCCCGDATPLTPLGIDRLRKLRLSHLRADLRFDSIHWKDIFDQAIQEADQLQTNLHIALHFGVNLKKDLKEFEAYCNQRTDKITLWLLFSRTKCLGQDDVYEAAKSSLTRLNPTAIIAAGTNQNFAELNRNRPSKFSKFLPCYSINPQVHARDNGSLVESLAVQPQTVETAQQFAQRSVVVSPITLKPRHDPYPSIQSASITSQNEQFGCDPRQLSLFGAAWTLGSISRLASMSYLHSLTYFETSGMRGILNDGAKTTSSAPATFSSSCVFPVYHLLYDLVGFDRVLPTHSSHPLLTEGLTLTNSKGDRRILVANYVQQHQEIRIKSGTCRAMIRYLDETSVEDSVKNPELFQALRGSSIESRSGKLTIELKPFALARLDIIESESILI